MSNWQDHWQKMPDFVQEKQTPFAHVNIRFPDQEALDEFIAKTGMKLTPKTKSAWYPEAKPSGVGMMRWK